LEVRISKQLTDLGLLGGPSMLAARLKNETRVGDAWPSSRKLI
jgi:hypothetical protein